MDEIWRLCSPSYELSNKGRLRRATDSQSHIKKGYLLTPTKGRSRTCSYHMAENGTRHPINVVRLMKEFWPEIEFNPDDTWLSNVNAANRMENDARKPPGARRGKKAVRQGRAPDTRTPCAGGCGRMITDYRCEACWQKLRGNDQESHPPAGYNVFVQIPAM